MKLIQQSKLFFKEGNSDKVYEIDLCELSPNEYLVNFRYGKRGSTLKEGTKTPSAIPQEKASVLFAELENEKRKKGYQTETEVFMELPSLESVEPGSVKGAILQRLQDAVAGTNSFKTAWKTSRVIWKAGGLQIEEAIPFIIKLATRGDEMQVYSSLWALVQLRAVAAAPLFNALAYNIRQKAHIRNLALEGLLTITPAEELLQLRAQLRQPLPAEVQHAIETGNTASLEAYLLRDTQQGQVDYFTNLYLLCKIEDTLLPVLNRVLQTWAFRPPYFRHIRAIYKLAQLRKDTLLIAALSYRFEKEPALFKRTASLDSNYKQYLSAINQSVRVGAELKSAESKLAFSHFTKAYFQKNAITFLQDTGKGPDARTYLKLAVSTLLQYSEADYTPAGERPLSDYGQYNYQTKQYTFTLINYPECAATLLLSTILFGNDVTRKLQPNLKFITGKRLVTGKQYYYSPGNVTESIAPTTSGADQATATSPQTGGSVIHAAVNVFKNLFGRKTTDLSPQEEKVYIPPVAQQAGKLAEQPRPELYPEHWDAMPEAYIQLLMQARMDIIHRFAYNNLKVHTDFGEIVMRFDGKALLQLLDSSFALPNQLGFEVLQKREAEFYRQPGFVGRVLDSNSAPAREWAQALVTREPETYCSDLEFTMLLLFNTRKENNLWINTLLQKTAFAEERVQAVLGKTVTELLHWKHTGNNNDLAATAIGRLNIIASSQLERISWDIVEQLISSPLEANKILAGTILIHKSQHTSPTEIPVSLTALFLGNEVPEVRQKGIQLCNQYPDSFLTEHISFVLNQTDSGYSDVVTALLNRMRAMMTDQVSLGNRIVHHLVYTLIRKEKAEGMHALLSDFVGRDLKPYWNSGLQPKDITKLIHAQYRISQLTGYDILKTYHRPADFSLAQIISFGSHELLAMRQWCWNYFQQNADRIRSERDKALNLLDSKWEDTRTYAFHFFRTEFTEADWDADTLISVVDAIRPDVESFGKELITRYFRPEQAIAYLTRLSEHPSPNVQAFVSSYLSLYAASQPELLKQLDFYFRSVLTRVNKARVAKDRIFIFLKQEALKSVEVADWVVPVLDDISAQSTIEDKATCIHILTEIKSCYPQMEMHLMIKN